MNRIGAVVLLAVAWLFCSHAAEPAPAPVKKAERKLQFVLRNGILTAIVGSQELPLNTLQPGGSGVALGGIKFSAGPSGGIQILSDADVSIGSPDLKGWDAELPGNVTATFNIDFEKQRMGVTMPPHTDRSVFLYCDAGGQVEFKSGAKGQIDFFKNGSYLFKGSGELVAVNSDGQSSNFSVPGTAMTGGPLVLKKTPGGNEYWERASPTVVLKVSGTPGLDFQITSGNGTVYKPSGGTVEVNVDDLGARIVCTEQADGSVNWKVDKGDFHITLDGIPGMAIFGDSGDAGSMSWEKSRKLADIKNTSGDPIQVTLPGRSLAAINSGAEFQYSMVSKGIFSAAAAGGDVQLYNGNGDPVSNLQAGNLLLDAKRLIAGLTSGNGLLMRLTWDNGVPLQANAEQAFAQLPPGTERIMKFGTDGEAKVTYAAGGFLTVEAIRSNFRLGVEAVHGLSIDLVEGDAVSLTLDLKKGTFVVKADTQNINDVAVTTESGYSPVLEAARALNFNIGKDGLLATSGGQPVFFAANAQDAINQSLTPPPPHGVIDTTQLNPPTSIIEPPVSPVRPAP